MVSSAILHLLGWPSWRSETCYTEQTIESKTWSYFMSIPFSFSKSIFVVFGCFPLVKTILGESDSQWSWSLARKIRSTAKDPRWPRDTTLLQEVAIDCLEIWNSFVFKVRVLGWTSPEMVDPPHLLCHLHLEEQHLLQVDRTRWFNQRLKIFDSSFNFPHPSRTTCECFARPRGNFLLGHLTACLH